MNTRQDRTSKRYRRLFWKRALERTLFGLFFALMPSMTTMAVQEQEREDALRQEEETDYYQKWLEEDAVYLITEEEKAVFQDLTTPEEKEQFIEQFWFRRDPDPRTSDNEFKIEHYRRIAYANEQFDSGLAGWRTDRGRIYIIHGPPDNIEKRPSGGTYRREMHEGGGTTGVFPFERWWYRHIPGLGSDIELEFVDDSYSGEYRLALYPHEKDAFLHVPGAGQTWLEEAGLATRRDRPAFNPVANNKTALMYSRAKDNPFLRYETFVNVQRPQEIKYLDLKEMVDVDVSFETLDFDFQQDFFKLTEDRVLVPMTLGFENKDLTFEEQNGVFTATLGVYGVVTSITNRIIMEFEDDIVVSFPPERLEQGRRQRSVYQKVVLLDKKMRYRLDLVLKDLHSGNVGVTRTSIAPPSFGEEDLKASSLILADVIQELPEIPNDEEMFVIGDVKVRPSLDRVFPADSPVGVYFQVYNAGLDQSAFQPSLSIEYRVIDDQGDVVAEYTDSSGQSIQFFSRQRVVLMRALPAGTLGEGRYRLQIEVHDEIGGDTVAVEGDFRLASAERWAMKK